VLEQYLQVMKLTLLPVVYESHVELIKLEIQLVVVVVVPHDKEALLQDVNQLEVLEEDQQEGHQEYHQDVMLFLLYPSYFHQFVVLKIVLEIVLEVGLLNQV
jgi:hypothetical protein